ncbi:MAG: hypothetical protein Q4F69_06160 [Bacteroidia bacterium]|nr:hypothetical protein [Bacteroidia bacterium]
MPLFKHSGDILSGLNEMLPKEFYTLGDGILNYIEKKQDVENAIVIIHFQNVIAKKIIKVSCDIIYKQNGIPFQQKSFIETIVSAYELPQYIYEGIRKEQIESIKLNSYDLEFIFEEKKYSIEKSRNWNDIIKSCLPYTKRVVLSDRVLYTIIDCYNERGDKISVMRFGVIDELPDDISRTLYPGKSREVIL